jgi:HSP20 family protein
MLEGGIMPRHRSAAHKAHKSESTRRPQSTRQTAHVRKSAQEKNTSNVLPLRSKSSGKEMASQKRQESLMAWPMQMLDLMLRPWRSFMPFADTFMQEVANFPRTETRETDRAYLYTVELPGVMPDQIALHLQNGMLMLEVEDAQVERGKNARRQFKRSFRRTFSLPVFTDSESIKASLRDGMLTISIPKTNQPVSPHSRDIDVQ